MQCPALTVPGSISTGRPDCPSMSELRCCVDWALHLDVAKHSLDGCASGIWAYSVAVTADSARLAGWHQHHSCKGSSHDHLRASLCLSRSHDCGRCCTTTLQPVFQVKQAQIQPEVTQSEGQQGPKGLVERRKEEKGSGRARSGDLE